MTNQVAAVNTDKVVGNFTKSELDTIKNTIAVGTSDNQFKLFVQTCVNSGLNPFLNHIYCIVYGGKMSVQVSVEGILSLARKVQGYRGVDSQMVHENDNFKFNAASKEIVHDIGFPRGKIIGGYAVAKREDFDDVVTVLEANEIEHMKKSTNKAMWEKWFSDMFKKHLIKRAAKQQYGIEITEDEPISSSAVEDTPSYERRDITPNAPEQAPKQIQVDEEEKIDLDEEFKKKQSEVMSKMKEYNISNNELQELSQKNFNLTTKELNLQQLTGLIKLMDLENKNRKKEQKTQIIDVVEQQEEQQEPPVDPNEPGETDFENMQLELVD